MKRKAKVHTPRSKAPYDAEKHRAQFAKTIGATPSQASAILAQFELLLEVQVGKPFSLKPGRTWWPGKKRPGTWARGTPNHWTKAYLRPEFPPPSPTAFVQDSTRCMGKPWMLSTNQVMAHLGGNDGARAQCRPERTGLITIDIDEAKRSTKAANAPPVSVRIRQVVDALGKDLPFVFIRSSGSGGVHMYLRTTPISAGNLRWEIVRRLTSRGVTVAKGCVEVFPHGETTLRFPMGPGSLLLDTKTLQPWKRPKGGTRADEILEFLKRLRRAKVDLTDLRPVGRLPHSPRVPTSVSTTPPPQRPTKPASFGADFNAKIAQIKVGVTGYGRRNAEVFDLVRYLVHTELKTKKETREYLEEWARSGRHTSKAFDQDPDQARLEILRMFDAGMFERAHCHPPVHRPPPQFRSLTYHRISVLHFARDEGITGKRGFAKALRPWCLPEDAALWKALDPWLQRRLAKLLALLRYAQARDGGALKELAIGSNVLHDLCGHAAPPKALARVYRRGEAGEWQLDKTAYPIVVRAAVNLGFLKFVKAGVEGEHGNVYRVTLPPLTTSTLHPAPPIDSLT